MCQSNNCTLYQEKRQLVKLLEDEKSKVRELELIKFDLIYLIESLNVYLDDYKRVSKSDLRSMIETASNHIL